jgi:MFS transporter, OFA family, oxalate/formate antiporter
MMLYAWAFVMGLSSCFVYIPALTTVQLWYPQKKGLVSGIASMVFGLSAAIMSPLFGYLLTFLGLASMNIFVGMSALLTGLGGAYLAKPPDNRSDYEEKSSSKESVNIGQHGLSLTARESVRTRRFWYLWMTWAMQGAAGIAMVTLSISYGISLGFALESAVVILVAFNTTNGLGRLISGYLSDIFGRNAP